MQPINRTSAVFKTCGQRVGSAREYIASNVILRIMDPRINKAIPVLPASDAAESLKWWTEVCGFAETFRDATPPNYAGISRDEAYLHISSVSDKKLAREVGDQTMVRIVVQGIEDFYSEYQKRGGKVHPNGALQAKPWGTKEFAAIDPNGVCVTFQE